MQKRVYRKRRRRSYRRPIQRRRYVQRKHTPDIQHVDQDENLYQQGHDLKHDPDNILHLQSTIGNQAVQRMINPEVAPETSGNAFLA